MHCNKTYGITKYSSFSDDKNLSANSLSHRKLKDQQHKPHKKTGDEHRFT
jgi:hypothetical protein